MLLGDPPQNPFSTASVRVDHSTVSDQCSNCPGMCCKTRLLLAIGFGGEFWPCPCPALPSTVLAHRYRNLTPRLREANGGHRWRRTAEKLSKPLHHRHMRRDLAVRQPLEQPCHAINGVAYKPLRPKIEATLDALQHDLGDRDLLFAIGAGAFGVVDNPNLVVDEVVRIMGEERIDTFPGNPGRLRIGQ